MGLFSWGGKPIKVETLENTHRKLDRDILALEKINKVSGEWDRKIQELKKQKLLIKDEIERMNRNFNGKSYVKDGIESDF
tara:strand:- start:191 stop:430 length:240 start_codon:yes stop_codon:yes gene_type:complete